MPWLRALPVWASHCDLQNKACAEMAQIIDNYVYIILNEPRLLPAPEMAPPPAAPFASANAISTTIRTRASADQPLSIVTDSPYPLVSFLAADMPRTRKITNNARKTKNKSLAIAMEAPAMVVNPNTPAIRPTIKNINAHFSIV